jgi:hypothetical protein
MKTHEFTLVLSGKPTEAKADRFYGICNDGTLGVIAGVAHVHFHRRSGSLEEALRSALADVRAAKLKVERVEMQPGAVLQVT